MVSGCGNNKEAEIKQNFNKTLSMYPIKNLENFYDKEGFRDEEFDKDDKGTWIINSKMIVEPKGKDMEARGMVLHINRNT
ncbi:PF04507 domain protein, partial [Staphylococcus epidermidis VCU013]